jgi:hypothetical protein
MKILDLVFEENTAIEEASIACMEFGKTVAKA